jgi:predicted dehydrogenase
MDRIRWGIIGTGNIGLEKVIPAMQKCAHGVVTAIASRDAAKARQVAERLGIPQAYGSYEELLAGPEIDAVYIPLPNHLHVPWSLRALAAGKHVLCEKPIALTAAEAQELLTAAQQYPHLKIMEAFMYRHHPQWRQAKQWVDEGRIGDLRTIQSFFSYYLDDPTNIRNMADIGGGGLLDIGCYTISLARFIFAAEPQRIFGIMERDPAMQVDRIGSGIMDFGRGTASFTYGTQLVSYQRVNIYGTTGRIEIEIPFNAPPDRPCKMALQTGDATQEITLPVADQYTIQADLFAQAVLQDTPVPTPLTDAVANMQAIEAFAKSAAAGCWVVPASAGSPGASGGINRGS